VVTLKTVNKTFFPQRDTRARRATERERKRESERERKRKRGRERERERELKKGNSHPANKTLMN
jgi:hypothetical protein